MKKIIPILILVVAIVLLVIIYNGFIHPIWISQEPFLRVEIVNPVKEQCSQNPDSAGYLDKICSYIKKNKLNVSPAKSETIAIRDIVEREYNGKQIIEVRLNCCGTGDSVRIDKQTGEVMDYIFGIY